MKSKHKNCIICLNGVLQKKLISSIQRQNSAGERFVLIAADGSSETLLRYNIIPDFIIGDMDSSSGSTLSYFKNRGTKVKQIKEQEHNDFEKTVKFALKNGQTHIAVIGFGGKRNDHTLNNYSVLKKFSPLYNIKLLDNYFEIYFLKKTTEFEYKTGKEISLIAFPKATGIKTQGLRYELNNDELKFGSKEGALNEAIAKTIKITFKSGEMLIFKRHFGNLGFDQLFL